MSSTCITEKVIAELDKAKGTRAIPRIDANLIMNLSPLLTAENQDTCLCLRKITRILSNSLKKYTYETDEFVKIKDIFLKLIQDCFLRIPLLLEHSSGQKILKEINNSLRSIVQVLLEIANNGNEFRNYYFMNLFKMIMLILFSRNEKIEFASQKILFLLVKDHIIKLLPRTLKYLMNNNDDVLELLAIWLPHSADYETQEAIMEILMLFSARSKQKYIKMKNWFKNYPSFYQAIDNLGYNHFIESSREFLIEVNKQITNNVKVYILPCVKAYADDIELKKPQSDLYKEFWVDFSVRSGHIQVYCSAGEGQWGKFSIDFSNVNCISSVNENSEWKVKIEFICPLEIYIYSSKKNFKTVTLYFPCSLKFQEIQNNFFLIVFPHIYKIENEYRPNGIRKNLRDKAMFEQSFFSRSSVISSIRPVSPHKAMGLETSWSASVNERTSTPKRTNAGMKNQKRKAGPSNICNEIDSRICDVEGRKIKSDCQQLPSNNQNEVNLIDKDETIIQSVPDLQEVASDKFTKIDEQSEEICFSTPTGEIDCETLNIGINLIKNTQKNNIQHSNSNQLIKNIPESACTNVNKSQSCHDKVNNERFQEDRNISIENKNNMDQSSALSNINVIYKGSVPKKASLDKKQIYNNFSTALGGLESAKKESLHCTNESSVQKPVQTNLDDRENFEYKTENEMKRNCEKNIEKYKMHAHKPRSYRIGYNRSREIKELEKDTNEIANKRKSQRSNHEFKKTFDRIGEDKIKVYNHIYQDDQLESVRKKELYGDAREMKRKSQKVEPKTGIEIMQESHDTVEEGKVIGNVSRSNEDDHLELGIVKEIHKDVGEMKSKSQGIKRETFVEMNKASHDSEEENKIKEYDPRSYENNQFETGGIKELDNDTSLIKNKSQKVEQKLDNEMKKIPRESVEADKIKVYHPRCYQDNQFETERMKELDNDTSLIKNKLQTVEQKLDNEMKKIPRESVEADKIKVYHPRCYQDNQFETERMKELDNDTSLIKNKLQTVEQKLDNEMKKATQDSVNDTSLIRKQRKADSGMKKASWECVEEQEIKVCDPRTYQDSQFELERVQELDNNIHVIKKKAKKVQQKSDSEIKKAQDFGFSVVRPIRTYSKSKYPKKSSILDNTTSALFDSIKQTLDYDKINDSINLSNERLRSRRENIKRKLYTPGIEKYVNDSLDNDYEGEDVKKTKRFFSEKFLNIKKDHSPILFDDVSEAVNDCIKIKYRSGSRKSNNMHKLRNLPRKTYKEVSTDESSDPYVSRNARKCRKLELTTSPSDKSGTSGFSYASNSSASSKKPARKLLSYTRTKYGKSRPSNESRSKKLQNNDLIDDVKLNTENNLTFGEACIINEAASTEKLLTYNTPALTSKLDSLLENDLKDPVTDMLAKEEKKKMLDGISRMMINARSALSEEIIEHGKQYYDTVRKLQLIITNVGNQLQQMSTLCNDIENTTDLVNKAVSQPINDRELHEFVSYLKENNYYLELTNEQVNDKNIIAKINAYFDKSMNNNE